MVSQMSPVNISYRKIADETFFTWTPGFTGGHRGQQSTSETPTGKLLMQNFYEHPQSAFQPSSRLIRVLDWTLRILLAITYVVAGSMKLAGAQISVQIFEAIGIGHWFRHFTGVLEIVCGILILFPRMAVWAALLLACTMMGALITHAVVGGDAVLHPSCSCFVW
jgi:putative oxidoreductase